MRLRSPNLPKTNMADKALKAVRHIFFVFKPYFWYIFTLVPS